jgi:hypothetical protein
MFHIKAQMWTLELLRAASLTFLISTSAEAQQAASKDLVRPTPVVAASTQKDEKPEYLKGCEQTGVGFVDGVTIANDKIPRHIKVELVSINDTNLIIGSEIVATVKMRNAGRNPIQIPWSTNFQTTQDGQDPENLRWEFGQFQIALRNKKGQYDGLMNTSEPLYGSMSVPNSMLTIKPGEWITAQISFQVTTEHPEYEQITEGTSDLALEWFQTVRTRVVKDCGIRLGYFPYDSFYDHDNRVVVRRVEIKSRTKMQKSSQ